MSFPPSPRWATGWCPGVQIAEPDLERYFAFDPGSILTFSRQQKLLGAVAFLYLNRRGHDALMHAEMNLAHPDFSLLAGRSDEVSAIYVWAIAAAARRWPDWAMCRSIFAKPRLASADLYAQPSSEDGRDLMIAIGFEPIPSLQRELWRYQRPWNRHSAEHAGITVSREFCRCTALNPHHRRRPGSRSISIRIARDPNDLMLVTAIRAAVYLAEQDCPIEEEFDGNDLVAAHFIGFIGN